MHTGAESCMQLSAGRRDPSCPGSASGGCTSPATEAAVGTGHPQLHAGAQEWGEAPLAPLRLGADASGLPVPGAANTWIQGTRWGLVRPGHHGHLPCQFASSQEWAIEHDGRTHSFPSPRRLGSGAASRQRVGAACPGYLPIHPSVPQQRLPRTTRSPRLVSVIYNFISGYRNKC